MVVVIKSVSVRASSCSTSNVAYTSGEGALGSPPNLIRELKVVIMPSLSKDGTIPFKRVYVSSMSQQMVPKSTVIFQSCLKLE